MAVDDLQQYPVPAHGPDTALRLRPQPVWLPLLHGSAEVTRYS